MKALSIRQPWAWLIIHGGKDIENRNWRTEFRGKFLIHAAKGCTKDEYENVAYFAKGLGILIPSMKDLNRGGIIGTAEITDCVRRSDSPWFFGKFGFTLSNAKPIPFVEYKGQLGFFNIDVSVIEKC